ncbi:hypothetical protein PRIPAC_72756 [Pristionchus pacificus]|uniref:Uncharacterized protein n=1 Tax=Pristionchus pacificus TaxID=54126 RepID=A0A2A6D039_PRIPA|nr:hypothetical protein PRIPAC_72756 [Pristionchus pacificus]|eukprot:PDM83641.1 hypothetical protein PRIPAC_30128 [Pristionchus pacificus]
MQFLTSDGRMGRRWSEGGVGQRGTGVSERKSVSGALLETGTEEGVILRRVGVRGPGVALDGVFVADRVYGRTRKLSSGVPSTINILIQSDPGSKQVVVRREGESRDDAHILKHPSSIREGVVDLQSDSSSRRFPRPTGAQLLLEEGVSVERPGSREEVSQKVLMVVVGVGVEGSAPEVTVSPWAHSGVEVSSHNAVEVGLRHGEAGKVRAAEVNANGGKARGEDGVGEDRGDKSGMDEKSDSADVLLVDLLTKYQPSSVSERVLLRLVRLGLLQANDVVSNSFDGVLQHGNRSIRCEGAAVEGANADALVVSLGFGLFRDWMSLPPLHRHRRQAGRGAEWGLS